MTENMQAMTEQMDAMLREVFKEGEPGGTVLVAKDGKPVFRKGYGMANVELEVTNQPQMVFRLGSITKQFTAVAILMLYEQGKLGLQDEITQYLPDYPTHGHTITIEHLLHHTSGIKSYTGMKEWMPVMRTDYSVEDWINFFKYQPMEFAPGEKWNYNNSGYFLLGAVIEKVSGQGYADFLKEHIFEPLGMTHTWYDMPNLIIPGRVNGYEPAGDAYQNAAYLSMTQPYAAGSLASSVDDMLLWDEALYTEKLVKQESLQKAWTAGKLNNGEETGYGYGWAMADFDGTHVITHGGGINGFITDGMRLPDDHVFVSILTNTGKGLPDLLAYKLAALAAGKPYQEPEPITLDAETLRKYEGVYTIELMSMDVPVELVDGELHAQIPMADKPILRPLSETEFFIYDSAYHVTFHLDEKGAVTGLGLKGIYGSAMEGVKTDKPLPGQRESVDLEPALLEQYTGAYQVAPGMLMRVELVDGRLTAQVPGQPVLQLHAESETTFFVKEAPVGITFVKDESGKVASALIDQGSQQLPAQRIK